MTAPAMRPYQADAVARVDAEVLAGHRRVLLVAPTGSGKTVMAVAMAKPGAKVLMITHRRELTDQAVKKFYAAGVDAGIVQAGVRPRPDQAVQVASVQTLHARAVRTHQMEMPAADLVIVDEAHHVRARTYQRILEEYRSAIIIGLTATPCRADGRGLGTVFDVIVECPPVAQLTKYGFLVPARIFAPSTPDLKDVATKAGDYLESQLAARVDLPALRGDIIEHWLRHADRRRTVLFATGVAHSLHLRDEFRKAGVLAEHIDGTTPIEERQAILRGLAAGTIEVVCNAMVLTEGWDCPDASCLVLARPTKSIGLYLQMVGRVLRPAPGKSDALILDHAGAVFMHGFPDDEITWTLREDKRAENRSRSLRESAGMPALTTCPECKAVRFGGKPCSICGWQPRPKAVPVEVADGQLGEVARNRTVQMADLDRYVFYAQLLFIAQEKNYARGWAAHKFKERFGAWPAWRDAHPMPPDDATRAWVRSRAIAYAKAMQTASA